MYEFGQGVNQDYEEACKYYKLSADQGNKNSQSMLGQMYLLGKYVKQDYKKSSEYFKLSEE